MREKIIENAFFFGLLALVSYIVWLIIFPFMSAFVLSAIIATVCYPLYAHILHWLPGRQKGLASLFSTLIVFLIVIVPLGLIGYFLFLEAASFYTAASDSASFSLTPTLSYAESIIHAVLPDTSIDLTAYAEAGAGWLANSMGSFFAGTASTLFLLLVSFIGLYYLFKDGERLVLALVHFSPLPDNQDQHIIDRLGGAVRSVVLGALTVSLIQGTLTALGFAIFGVPQAVLWGTVAAIASLVPSVGTALVFIPTIIFLAVSGDYTAAVGIAVWGTVIVGLVDNFLGPYLVGKRAALHPFLVFISVLGGLTLFGPIGFILGPVIMSFFVTLLGLYETHIMTRTTIVE